jgi:hypothetical protein
MTGIQTAMSRSWRTWRSLPWTERRLFVQALLLLPLVDLALRAGRYQSVYAFLQRRSPLGSRVPEGRELPTAYRYAQLVDAASRRNPFEATCLRRSLVLWWLLRRDGVDGMLRVGVRRPEGAFEAHAWVEVDGQVVNDRHDVAERYEPIL